jgi:alkanesulfonate monooxygenase SsuD/methylene tetrahydromethanopterin reductase-like flavin-dependent oxidoreductase (luciferase family)
VNYLIKAVTLSIFAEGGLQKLNFILYHPKYWYGGETRPKKEDKNTKIAIQGSWIGAALVSAQCCVVSLTHRSRTDIKTHRIVVKRGWTRVYRSSQSPEVSFCVCIACDKTHATLQIDKLLPYSKLPAKTAQTLKSFKHSVPPDSRQRSFQRQRGCRDRRGSRERQNSYNHCLVCNQR